MDPDHEGGNGAVISVEKARVEFGPLTAVNDVSFSLRSGELLGLIGSNGAGKTTLLRSLAGLQPLTSGSVHVLGNRLAQDNVSVLRYLGFTPDDPPVYESMTVRDFLRFIAMGYGFNSSEADERISFWLEKVWLKEKARQKIKSLSRGMRQRVGLARTLLPNPSVVLLDEPAAGIDPAGRVQFRQLLCDLREQGKAIVVSSHILSDMEDYCTHIGIMANGVMIRYGTVAEVAAHGDGDRRCRYTLVLARPIPQLEKLIGEEAGVSAIQVERERVVFEFFRDREEAARLLAALVARQIPIAAFSPNSAGLEEAYLRIGIQQVD